MGLTLLAYGVKGDPKVKAIKRERGVLTLRVQRPASMPGIKVRNLRKRILSRSLLVAPPVKKNQRGTEKMRMSLWSNKKPLIRVHCGSNFS